MTPKSNKRQTSCLSCLRTSCSTLVRITQAQVNQREQNRRECPYHSANWISGLTPGLDIHEKILYDHVMAFSQWHLKKFSSILCYKWTWNSLCNATDYVVECVSATVYRGENWFYAEVDTPPGDEIDFVLTYEQLLRRRLGVYQLSLHLGRRLVPILLTFIYLGFILLLIFGPR